MQKLLFLLPILTSFLCQAQTIIFDKADPRPDLAQVYGGVFASGDIDGDGDNDLFLSGITPGLNTKLYLNDGTGVFTVVEDAPFPTAIGYGSFLIDFNGDDNLDLLFTGYAGSSQTQPFTNVYLNDGQGNFTLVENSGLPAFTDTGINVADVDGDDDPDVIVAMANTNGAFLNEIFLNNGNATFTALGNAPFINVNLAAVEVIDVDNDEDVDLVIGGEDNNQNPTLALYLNDGSGNFSLDTQNDLTQIQTDDIDAADMDNDGDQDFLVTGIDENNNSRTVLFINDGAGLFEALSNSNLRDVFAGSSEIADLDNDGDMDIVLIGSPDGGITNGIINIVYENQGDNVYVAVDTVGGEYIAASVVDDFNGDNRPDLITQGFVDRTNVWWNNSMTTSVTDRKASFPVNVYPNPSAGRITLETEEFHQQLQLSVFTIDGRMVYQRKALSGSFQELQLDLPPGVYMLHLQTNKATAVKKLVVAY